jgi:hypothetical protein
VNPLPEEALIPARARTVLVFAELAAAVRAQLTARGARLVDAESVLGAVALLADRDFDAAILDMELSAALVQRLKSGGGVVDGVPDELCAKARERHRLTPFFLTMGKGFAVVVDPPEHSYLESGKGLNLADAVMTLDVSKLVVRGAPLA